MTVPYLAIEGIDGCGKSLQVDRLRANLSAVGRRPLVLHYTRKQETSLGRIITFLYSRSMRNPLARWLRRFRGLQAALYALNARENLGLRRHIRGYDVLLGDRSVVTAHVVHYDLFRRKPYLKLLQPRLIPNSVLILDVNPETAYERLIGRAHLGIDETMELMSRFREVFLDFASGQAPPELSSTHWTVIDGTPPPEQVAEEVRDWALSSLETYEKGGGCRERDTG